LAAPCEHSALAEGDGKPLPIGKGNGEQSMSRVAVIGAGAWGTALAIVIGRKAAHDVRLWAYEPEVCASIVARRTNDLFLPEAKIPDSVVPTNSLADALRDAEVVLSVMPSHHVRRLFTQMLPHLHEGMVFVSATKGVEDKSYMRMTEVIAEVVGKNFAPRIVAVSRPTMRSHGECRRI
jgi:glycerol-3-phosphate dehydrogenase (NAD(P)+)